MVKAVVEPVIVRLITDGLVELGGCRGDVQGKTKLPPACRVLVGLLSVQVLSNGSQWLCWMGSWKAQNGGVVGNLAQQVFRVALAQGVCNKTWLNSSQWL